MTDPTSRAPRFESDEEAEALAVLREERAQAQNYRTWDRYETAAWVENYDLDLT
jgi:hypothetical protein